MGLGIMRDMDIKTLLLANKAMLGTPIEIIDGVSAVVELKTGDDMVVDVKGLVHGGFAYGLADYAAMLAVNHPNVVLGRSTSRFTAPVQVGEKMRAEARVESVDGPKHAVNVEVTVNGKKVFIGEFICYVLDAHALDRI